MNDLSSANWYALYTKPRHEKFVEYEFTRKGIEAFTPKITLRRKWSDRIKVIKEPLFKSYCFVKFSLQSKNQIISQRGVLDLVHFKNQYINIPDSVISSLKVLTENQIKLDPYPYLKLNDKVVIKKGSLKGVEGFVVEKRNNNAVLVISIDAIASSVQCVVGTDCVELA